MNRYYFKGKQSSIYIFASVLLRGQLLKEQILPLKETPSRSASFSLEVYRNAQKLFPSVKMESHRGISVHQSRPSDLAEVTFAFLGPVVQSIVSLTSSLRGQLVKCFTTLYPNTLIFLLKKMREAFAHFFNKKILVYFRY